MRSRQGRRCAPRGCDSGCKLTDMASPNCESGPGRRQFLKLAGTAAALTAKSYARVLGANDRIRLAQLGCGGRGGGHIHMVHMASEHTPVEVAAVCDIWSFARERRAKQVKDLFGTEPAVFKYSEEMLARPD